MANKQPSNLLLLKKLFIYATLFAIATLTWTQLDSITTLYDDRAQLPVDFTLQTERDPATWVIQVLENESSLSQPSIFPADTFSKFNSQRYPSVTAILNRVDDSDEGILHAVDHLFKYPFIKEILVYNQIKSRPLTAEKLYPNTTTVASNDVRIEIIETDASLFNMGKFTACAVATFEKCYFQDDLWLNTYLDSLYTHSYRYPDHLIANTRTSNYIDYMTWRFKNKDISIHTGYADLHYGAFASREKVQTFLSQLSAQGLDSTKLKSAEIYFSIWLNQYPYLVSNPLMSSGRDSFKHIDTVNNRLSVEHYLYDALSLLEISLKNASLLDEDDFYFEKNELSPPVEERDVRSSCVNDRCLFITNIDNMPNIGEDSHIQFSSTDLVTNISHYEALYHDQFASIPNRTVYAHHSYHKAVDQDTETCWHSVQYPKADDYFGLYMVGDIQAKRVMMYTTTKFDMPLNEIFKVTVQWVPFGSWEECNIKLTPHTQLAYRIGFEFDCPDRHLEPFKSIRISFQRNMSKSFELCGLALDNFMV